MAAPVLAHALRRSSQLVLSGTLVASFCFAAPTSASRSTWSGRTVDAINVDGCGSNCLLGTGKGTVAVLGKVTDTMRGALLSSSPTAPSFDEFITLTMRTRHGDTLVFAVSGTLFNLLPKRPGYKYRLSYTWKILKGTGKLRGTTGRGTITGTLETDPTVPTGIEHRTWKGLINWKT
jgi:hypothetical protein